MEGFLPLIEGFLAFALTMLALTTAVSAIVGAGHRLRRRRARGLRDMVRLLYLREVKPHLPKAPTAAAAHSERSEFISDMTLMPLPVVVKDLEVQGEKYWKKKLESAERLAGRSWFTKYRHPKRWARKWRTLRYGLDALTDAEFMQRLAESKAGKDLKAMRTPEAWKELEAHLLKSFQTIGAASSETFARHSRSLSVLVGFLLAFGVNVDSFDLLNSYLTNPELRASVVQQSGVIQAEATSPSADEQGDKQKTTLDATRERLAATSQEIVDSADEVVATIATQVTTALGEDQKQELDQAIKAELAKVVQKAATDLEGAVQEGLTEAESDVRGVVRSLTASFPVGWSRFPNCFGDGSPDLRCAGRTTEFKDARETVETESPGKPWWQKGVDGVGSLLPKWLQPLWTPISGTAAQLVDWRVMLGSARRAAPADFSQWLAGVILTGFLLGLGTPFWIQVVNSVMSLQRWAKKGEPNEEKGGASSAGGQPGAPAGSGSAADAEQPFASAPFTQPTTEAPAPGPTADAKPGADLKKDGGA
ncbi:MAG: hypothetical protein ACE5GX_17335 [Thermoanaerobaculia bacterium]